MNKHHLLAIAVAVLTLGIWVTTNPQSADARTLTTVPTSLRGHWYHFDSEYGVYDQLKASKYHFYTKSIDGWYKLSGKKFPSYAMGHSELVVKKTPKKYYIVAKYATDSFPYWKRVTHKGHTALRAVTPDNLETTGSTIYWYQSKAIAKRPSVHYHSVTDNDNLYYNSYSSAYLQADASPVKLYTTPTDAVHKTGKTVTLSSIFKKIAIRWNEKYDKQNLLNVRLNGTTYYVLDTDALQKYNSWRDGNGIMSPYAPSTTSKIVLEHGAKVATATLWEKVIHYKNGTEVVDTWHKQNGRWIKDN